MSHSTLVGVVTGHCLPKVLLLLMRDSGPRPKAPPPGIRSQEGREDERSSWRASEARVRCLGVYFLLWLLTCRVNLT